ncbi:Hypothetical predicted protein [Olea europaea subsp. europaea]|uniref:Uncharacterized protein n=1 Tax=Olea europaea subsp. europaea TaxID=158383 RepID=A0A8S0T864_OLEEU|nr:Hypothetical predicted protein [Olea europaea subsp. europaea]
MAEQGLFEDFTMSEQGQKDVAIGIDLGTSNHPKSGVTSPLANDYELFSGSIIYNIKRLLCIPVPDTDLEVLQSKYLFLVQLIELGVMQLIAPLVNGTWTSTTPEEVLAILLKEIKDMVETKLKCQIRKAVLTIPVAVSRYQQEQLTRACNMSDLHV